MRLSSGGGTRRKRGKAARLQPAGEDPSSTSQLFDAPRPCDGRGPATGPAAASPNGEHPAEPLLRYEWRNAAGETLILEAAWPVAPGTAPESMNGANGHNGNGHGPSRVDLRQVTELR